MSDELRQVTERLRHQVTQLERVLHQQVQHQRAELPGRVHDTHPSELPAWLRSTVGEQRITASLAVLVAVALQVVLPERFAPRPHPLLPGLELALLVIVMLQNPGRINRESALLRGASFCLLVTISCANGVSAVLLVRDLIGGVAGHDPGALFVTGAAIWGTNVIVFALWYWELDREGPAARALGRDPHPDFLFPQMAAPRIAPAHWEPTFVDYLYLSFTNAATFGPTDVMPLSRLSKAMMLVQAVVSIIALTVVISRAVNAFG